MYQKLKCEQVELFVIPPWATKIIFSNGDGGNNGIRYRYVEWLKSLSARSYTSALKQKQMQHAKPLHYELIDELEAIEEPQFYLEDCDNCDECPNGV